MSTERMDNNQGTARMDTDTMSDGTARMDDSTARIGGTQGVNPISGGNIFAVGQTIALNGNSCIIEKLVSMGTGEAVIYKIKMNDTPYVLKHYKPNTPLSNTAKQVLTKIKDNPKERIVKIIDFGDYHGQDFEIMEYAEGGTLSDYIKKNGAIRDNRLKEIVKQINEGLVQLHSYYRIIYQDLKPENIFFRDAKTLVLADFGISSVMQEGSEEVEVVASNTDLYAAPELARIGNATKVEITPAVDYFALGITIYELWLGEQPFKDIKRISRERIIRDNAVVFPVNMPDDCKTLIQGLIDSVPKNRWRNEHIQKWLKGENIAPNSSKFSAVTDIIYSPPINIGNESASNRKELAALMEKYPKVGKDCLYDGFITDALKEARDATTYSDIKEVIAQYGKDKEAGLTAAIFTLDPERPFISRTGKVCNSSEEIADAIMADSAHYMEELKNNSNANLYVYITVTGGSQGKDAADTFRNFFNEYPPNRALTLVYLKLQSDGSIPLGSKRYLNINELAQEKDNSQIDIIKKAVNEKDSPLLVWIFDKYGDYFKSTDEFNKLSTSDQFFLLGLIPFLSYKELSGKNGEEALQDLIDHHPGRQDLFETYVAQSLPLKGQILDSHRKTPIDYVVCNINNLFSMHGSDTVYNLIHLLNKLGADVNEYSSDGRCPFINALKNNDLVKLLVELGAEQDFVSKNGKICKSAEEIADALMDESVYYMDELKNSNTDLYLYLLATDEIHSKEFVDKFNKYFREYSSKRALSLVFIQLQNDLGITVGSKRYQNLEELKQEKDSAQIDLIKRAVNEKDSLLFGWITVHDDYFGSFTTIETFNNLTVPDQFYLLWLMPFLSYKELKGSDWEQSAISDLQYLIDNVPGNTNLFEAYAAQGLQLKEHTIEDSTVKRTPIDYIVCCYDDLKKHGDDTICELIRLLCKLGSDINEYSSDGTCPLINAFESFFEGKNDLIELLLELGADADKYRKYLEDIESHELKKQKEMQQHEADNQRIQEDIKLKRRLENERQLTKLKFRAKAKKTAALVLIFAPIIAITGYCFYNGWLAFLFNRHLTIPDNVTIIADKEFAGKQLTSVDIPESVSSIGDNAFSRNGLISIVIPDSVESIGNNAFNRNRLTSVNIANSVASIGANAFANNKITEITIGPNVELGEEAFGYNFEWFYNNNGMLSGTYIRTNTESREWSSWHEDIRFLFRSGNIRSILITDYKGKGGEIVIPEEISGYPVTAIGDEVFKEKNITSVTIPNNIVSIGREAFFINQLTNVTIPNSVTTIGVRAFSENQLTSVSIGNGVTLIGIHAFMNNQLTSIIIPNNVNNIGWSAFDGNPITSVRIGANVTLGTDPSNTIGILGQSGFNSAYTNNGRRAGTYTRANADSRSWTRR